MLMSEVPNTGKSFIEVIVLPGMYLVLDELKEWPDNDLVVDKFKSMCEKFPTLMKNVFLGKNNMKYSVLNHCDFHFKNIMFKKDEEKLGDMLLVKFLKNY